MRPDPHTFNPDELDPNQLTAFRGFVDRVFRDVEPREQRGPSKIEPMSWWAPFVLPPQPKPTLVEAILGRLFSRVLNDPKEAAKKAKQKVLLEAVVWGMWAGFFAGAQAAHQGLEVEMVARDLLAATAYAMNPHGIDLPFWGAMLLSPDSGSLTPPAPATSGPGSGAASAPPHPLRDPPLEPAWPDRSLLKQLFLPRSCRQEYVSQLVRAAPWPPGGGDAATLEKVAPCLPGALASLVFGGVAPSLAEGVWPAVDQREPMDVTRAWIRQRVFAENPSGFLEGDKGQAVDRLNEEQIWQRHRPLLPPFSCVDLLHVALWANLDASSFDDVIGAVRSLGGDAVACAAAGTFAGARFGKEGIPAAALNRIPPSCPVGDMARRFAEINAP